MGNHLPAIAKIVAAVASVAVAIIGAGRRRVEALPMGAHFVTEGYQGWDEADSTVRRLYGGYGGQMGATAPDADTLIAREIAHVTMPKVGFNLRATAGSGSKLLANHEVVTEAGMSAAILASKDETDAVAMIMDEKMSEEQRNTGFDLYNRVFEYHQEPNGEDMKFLTQISKEFVPEKVNKKMLKDLKHFSKLSLTGALNLGNLRQEDSFGEAPALYGCLSTEPWSFEEWDWCCSNRQGESDDCPQNF